MLSVLCVVVGAFALIAGLVAVATERLPPWLGGHVARPRVWGLGLVTMSAYLFVLASRYPPGSVAVALLPLTAVVLLAISARRRYR